MRGTNTATVRDIVDLRKFLNTKTVMVSNMVTRVEDRLRDLQHLCKDDSSVKSRVSRPGSRRPSVLMPIRSGSLMPQQPPEVPAGPPPAPLDAGAVKASLLKS